MDQESKNHALLKVRTEIKEMCEGTTRECRVCKKRKDIEEFDVNIFNQHPNTYIYANRCKECRRKYRREMYNKKKNEKALLSKKYCSICQKILPSEDFTVYCKPCKKCMRKKYAPRKKR